MTVRELIIDLLGCPMDADIEIETLGCISDDIDVISYDGEPVRIKDWMA